MSQEVTITSSACKVLDLARKDAQMYRNPFITPEHVLFQIESSGLMEKNLVCSGISASFFRERLGLFLSSLSTVEPGREYTLKCSTALRQVLQDAVSFARRDNTPLGICHLLFSMAGVNDSLAGYLILNNIDVVKDVIVPFEH